MSTADDTKQSGTAVHEGADAPKKSRRNTQLPGQHDVHLIRLQKTLVDLMDKNDDINALVAKVPLLMQAIEQANHVLKMPGPLKKALIIDAIVDFVNQEKDEGDELVIYFARHVLPPMIDTLVMVDNGQLQIAVNKCVAGCFGRPWKKR